MHRWVFLVENEQKEMRETWQIIQLESWNLVISSDYKSSSKSGLFISDQNQAVEKVWLNFKARNETNNKTKGGFIGGRIPGRGIIKWANHSPGSKQQNSRITWKFESACSVPKKDDDITTQAFIPRRPLPRHISMYMNAYIQKSLKQRHRLWVSHLSFLELCFSSLLYTPSLTLFLSTIFISALLWPILLLVSWSEHPEIRSTKQVHTVKVYVVTMTFGHFV